MLKPTGEWTGSVADENLAKDAPALIEVRVDRERETSPWEFLMPAAG